MWSDLIEVQAAGVSRYARKAGRTIPVAVLEPVRSDDPGRWRPASFREAGEAFRQLFAGSTDDRQLCGTGKVWGIMASWTSPRFGRTSASPASHG